MKTKQKMTDKIYFPSKKLKKLWEEKIAKSPDIIIKNIPFKDYLTAAAFVNIGVILISLILQGFLPPQVPLLYGLPEGESQLVSSLSLVIPSIVSLIFMVINIFVAYLLKDEFFKKILVIAVLGLTIFSATTTIKIILLMISF